MQSLIPLLGSILSAHRQWFETKGNSGVFADLSEENLEEGIFEGAVLIKAIFQVYNNYVHHSYTLHTSPPRFSC